MGYTMGMGVEDVQYLFSNPSKPTGWWEGASLERWGLHSYPARFERRGWDGT
jgi:hypothetical protein